MNHKRQVALGAAVFLAMSASTFAEPAVDMQTRCFRFVGQPEKLVQLRLVTTQGGNEAAFVRYNDTKTWIALVLLHRKYTPMANSGRGLIDTDWSEVVKDQVSGHYALSMQGNEISSFTYVNRKTSRQTEFELAPTPRGVDPCATNLTH
jgi:hypothetical protein